MDKPVQSVLNPILSVSDGSAITHAGEAANRAAADYLFTDYRQRRAAKTIKTQTAALLLWVQYLAEVGAATRLLAEAADWAPVHFDEKVLAEMAEYTVSQQISLPTYIWRSLLPVFACRLAGRNLGAGGRICQMASQSRV